MDGAQDLGAGSWNEWECLLRNMNCSTGFCWSPAVVAKCPGGFWIVEVWILAWPSCMVLVVSSAAVHSVWVGVDLWSNARKLSSCAQGFPAVLRNYSAGGRTSSLRFSHFARMREVAWCEAKGELDKCKMKAPLSGGSRLCGLGLHTHTPPHPFHILKV